MTIFEQSSATLSRLYFMASVCPLFGFRVKCSDDGRVSDDSRDVSACSSSEAVVQQPDARRCFLDSLCLHLGVFSFPCVSACLVLNAVGFGIRVLVCDLWRWSYRQSLVWARSVEKRVTFWILASSSFGDTGVLPSPVGLGGGGGSSSSSSSCSRRGQNLRVPTNVAFSHVFSW